MSAGMLCKHGTTLGMRCIQCSTAIKYQRPPSKDEFVILAQNTTDRQREIIRGLVEAGTPIQRFHAFIPDAKAMLDFDEALAAARKFLEGEKG